MAKAISSASEFLAATAGKTLPFEVEGVTVQLRSLEWAETESLLAMANSNPAEVTFRAALLGLNGLVDEAQLRTVIPGAVQKISAEVMRISGMGQEGGSPLAGTGS